MDPNDPASVKILMREIDGLEDELNSIKKSIKNLITDYQMLMERVPEDANVLRKVIEHLEIILKCLRNYPTN